MASTLTAGAANPIREKRRAAGLSQQALAHRSDCSLTMIRLLETGYEPAGSAVLPRVLSVLEHPDQGETAEGLAA